MRYRSGRDNHMSQAHSSMTLNLKARNFALNTFPEKKNDHSSAPSHYSSATIIRIGFLTLLDKRIHWRTIWSSLMARTIKNLPAMLETWVQSLGREDRLEKGLATHSSILAWRIPLTEEPGEL